MRSSWRRAWAGAAILCAAATFASAAGQLSELGVDDESAKTHVLLAFLDGTVPMAGSAAVFKAASPEKRVVFVKAAIALAKTYSQTKDFKDGYAEYREANKPQPPADIQPFEEQQAEQRKQAAESLEQMKETLKALPPDAQKEMQKVIAEMQKGMASPTMDAETKAAYEQARRAQSAEGLTEYQQRVKKWEQEFPANPNGLVARRLREFLSETADLDLAAKLVRQGDKMIFADPKYEQKSSQWKLCFRAGKEPTSAARALAEQWLKELQK